MGTVGYWGELYLRSTAPLLSAETTAREVAYLDRAFGGLSGPLVDLGCGHGRHLTALPRPVVGVDLDPLSLRRISGPRVRADFRALPFRESVFAGAYAWYSTLFIHDDATHLRTLREIARCLRPGGRLVLHTVPFERLEAHPDASFEGPLPDGSRVREESHFDASTGVDRGHRELSLPDGRVLSGGYAIRYHRLHELRALLDSAGFRWTFAHGDLEGGPVHPHATDLIVGAEACARRA